jgi:hypothetical protein
MYVPVCPLLRYYSTLWPDYEYDVFRISHLIRHEHLITVETSETTCTVRTVTISPAYHGSQKNSMTARLDSVIIMNR